MKNSIAPLILILVLTGQSIWAQAQFNEEITEKVDAYLKSQTQEFHGTILLATGNRILMNKGYDIADYSHNIPNTTDTKYLIGSTTKHFTAIMILQLAERGLIDLDDTIDKYFPDGPIEKTGKITIRQLLLHQSGIPQCYYGFPEYLEKQSRIYHSHEEYLQLIWESKFRHKPGNGVTYSSPGYYLLGVLLERVTNKSYSELLQVNILTPLNMKNTYVDNNLTIQSQMATGYQRGVTGIVRSRINEQSNHFGAGDLMSTTYDLFLFQRCLNYESDPILSAEYKRMLLDKQSKNNRYGGVFFGSKYTQYFNDKNDSLNIIGVGTSGSFGYRARMTRFVNEDACYIVLSNIETDNTMNEDLFAFLSNILLEELKIEYRFPGSEPSSTIKTDYVIDHKELTKYAGVYNKNENEFINISVSHDTLIYQSAFLVWGSYNYDRKYLVPVDKDVFMETCSSTEFHFQPLAQSENFHLIQIQNRDTIFTASKLRCNSAVDLPEYEGPYYSWENKETYYFKIRDEELFCDNFLGKKNIELTCLKKDMLSCECGFLLFERYADGKLKEFRLNAEGIDTYEGVKVALFEKR